MPRFHDHDAGGPAALLERKAALRRRVWRRLDIAGIRRFPGPLGRIPNFVGAEKAAERLRDSEPWQAAETVKANPDSPQWPVRQRALEDGKLLFMAVPRLAQENPFFVLDPEALEGTPRQASSIKGASASAITVPLEAMRPVDLVVTGCVAVDEGGGRLGKGGGFSDLEFALASAAGMIGAQTRIVTTVHEEQVVDAGEIPMSSHDVPLDLIVTPERVIACGGDHRRPASLQWETLTEKKIAAIPLLARLRPT
ncbi:MAG: 5-formyltetrahydrofolate cyclo-ligase [Acidobacteriota bacterium]